MDAPFPTEMIPCIERFFKEVHPTLVPGKNVYQEVFDTPLFFPLQRQIELEYMMYQAKLKSPVTVMEIGADKGGGLYHWCMSCPTVKHVIACEIRGLPYARLFEQAFPQIKFTWIEGSSYAPSNISKVGLALHSFGLPIDVLFIDGDKTKFLYDFDCYLSAMRIPNGLVFMHDINDPKGPMGSPHGATPLDSFIALQARRYRTNSFISRYDTNEELKRRDRDPHGPVTAHQEWLRYWNGRSCGVGTIYLD